MKPSSKRSRPKKRSGPKRSGPRKSGSKKPGGINFEPVLKLSVIGLLLIGFIYWSEHAPVKQPIAPVKEAAAPVKPAIAPVEKPAASARPAIEPVKRALEPIKQTFEPVRHVAEPVKRAIEPAVKKALEPMKRPAAPVKPASLPAKPAAAPVKLAKVQAVAPPMPAKPALPAKIVIKPPVVEKEEVRAEKKPVAPPPPRVRRGPKVAIVIDDFGYNMKNVDTFLDIKEPLTFAILPNQRYSREVAKKAGSRGYEVILHLPLESWRNDVKEEAVTIHSGMSENDINARLRREFADVPGATGASNHMGSKSTEDKELMTGILRYMRKNDLCFFDSFTTPRSVCLDVASETGVKFAKRDRFLDNANDIPSIEKQLRDLKDVALSRGRAIAVCHDRPNTAAALAAVMPEMARDGIEFVYLSEMVD